MIGFELTRADIGYCLCLRCIRKFVMHRETRGNGVKDERTVG